jgi:cation:H+ antiporter
MDFVLLVVALAVIIISAMMLTDGSVALAARLHVPEFIVGLTVVAVGTSMPELTVSMLSALNGHGDMAIGNVVGSNIFNVFAILGVCAIFSPVVFTKTNIRRDIPMCVAASLLLWVTTADVLFGTGAEGTIGRVEGIIFLLLYVAVILYSIRSAKKDAPDLAAAPENDAATENLMPWWKVFGLIIVGLAGLIYGGNMCLESATAIARSWGVSEAIIAITIVAAGTSLPELASSISAIISKKPSLALGNIIGSNIANILLILGASSTIKPLTMGNITPLDIYMVVGSAVVLLLSAVLVGKRKITRVEGLLYLAIYVTYVVLLMK